jgi:hypothetical protein
MCLGHSWNVGGTLPVRGEIRVRSITQSELRVKWRCCASNPARSAPEGLRMHSAEVLVLAVVFPEITNTEGLRLRRLRPRSFEYILASLSAGK